VAGRAIAAWDVLGDAARRASYDRLRAASHRPEVRVLRDRAQSPAYSPARVDYRRAFHYASLRVALVVFALGCVLLLAAR
jgi:curved DNA-binding protein CbpA